MTTRQHFHGDLRVPFITAWSSEGAARPPVMVRQGRHGAFLAYADEDREVDRRLGVLWVRMPATRGSGTPRFKRVHGLRQRQAMSHLLCQVCGSSTVGSRDDERSLFVVGSADGEPIREGGTTISPPVHATCALEAVRDCPHLREWAAALVRWTPPWGVAGILYHPKSLMPLPGPDPRDPAGLHFVPYTDQERLRWILASHEVVSLHGVEPVTDLAALAATEACPG